MQQFLDTALNDLEDFDVDKHKPKLSYSKLPESDAAEKAKKDAENEQFKLEFKSNWERYNKRKDAYDVNKLKSYGILWERCSKTMQQKLEARTDFKTAVKDNPVALLKAIREHTLYYQEDRYEMAGLTSAFKSLFNIAKIYVIPII